MSDAPNRWRHRAARATFALAVAAACLGGVAFAATGLDQNRPAKKGGAGAGSMGNPQDGPPRPSLIETPASVGVSPDAQFRFHVAPAARRPEAAGPATPASTPKWRPFECRIDSGGWSRCSSPHVVVGLDPGLHTFAVRALNRREQFGKAAHYRWTQLEPVEFTIDPTFGSLPELMPGDPPQQLPVRIGNPNPAAIEITSLTVAVSADRPGCAADPNFAVTASNLTPEAPLTVPAGGSADLPTAAATGPTLAMRDLPVDQNACQGAGLHLAFSGEARG